MGRESGFMGFALFVVCCWLLVVCYLMFGVIVCMCCSLFLVCCWLFVVTCGLLFGVVCFGVCRLSCVVCCALMIYRFVAFVCDWLLSDGCWLVCVV